MDQQAAPGWYDVGDGIAGYWDGTRWTGERISLRQLRAMSQPPQMSHRHDPPPPGPQAPARRAGRGIPWYGWLVLIVLFIFVGLPLLSAFLQGFTQGLGR